MVVQNSSSVKVENTQTKILQSIDDLKKMEEELYNELQTSGANEDDVQKQQEIISRIENVSAIRKDLLNSLTDRYIDIQDNVVSSRSDLVQQTAMVGIVQDELDKANANINEISTEKSNKIRMVELNTYERERYRSYMEIMKIACLSSVVIVIFLIMGHKGIIGKNIVLIVVGAVIAIAGIIIFNKYLDISNRDNLYFQKYDYPTPDFDDDDDDGRGGGDDNSNNVSLTTNSPCANEDCCSSGQSFDSAIGKCITSANVVQESFVASPYLNIRESNTIDLGYSQEVKPSDTRFNQNGSYAKF